MGGAKPKPMDKLREQLASRTTNSYWQLRVPIKVENVPTIANWGDADKCSKPAVLINNYIELLDGICHYLGVDSPTEAHKLITTQHLRQAVSQPLVVEPVLDSAPKITKSKAKLGGKSEAEAAFDQLF